MANSRASRRPSRAAPSAAPDAVAMASAVRDFLRAAGLPLSDANLVDTPERVAEAWAEEFLDGYRSHARGGARARPSRRPPDSSGELVVVTDLRFQSMCPHHLLPFEGRAHVAYVPGKRVVGFGRLSALVDCFAHRLILQEDLARAGGQLARAGAGQPRHGLHHRGEAGLPAPPRRPAARRRHPRRGLRGAPAAATEPCAASCGRGWERAR